MNRSAVLEISDYHIDQMSGLPDWWIWSLRQPGSLRTEFNEVRLASADELKTVYALPDRIAQLRKARAGVRALEKEVRVCGEWIARTGLGRTAACLRALGPVAVELRLPPRLSDFEALPWELALFDDRPLVRDGVIFIRGVRPRAPMTCAPGSPLPQHLRMLALFSLPWTASPVDLGAHRSFLNAELLDMAASGSDEAVPLELRTRQFGVSRGTLERMVAEPDGWDVLHVVAHGQRGSLLLERADGTVDEVRTSDVVGLLRPGSCRIRLVFLSACWSGSEVAADEGGARPAPAPSLTSLASAVATELGCAVVAMRFPVSNDFARVFAVRLYSRLFRDGHTLPQAVHKALVDIGGNSELDEVHTPLLAAATPVLFGATARGQRLPDRPMTRGPARGHVRTGVGALPDSPSSFVGRQREMTGASRTLAPESGLRGVVVHGDGERGMGVTACASLLAHDHREAFDVLLWHPSPAGAKAIPPSPGDPFEDLLRNLIIQAPGLERLGSEMPWPEYLDAAMSLRLLLVIDAADRAIAGDSRFASLVEYFTRATGPGRILLTSEDALPHLAPVLPRVPLNPLSGAELTQMARRLSGLGRLARDPRTSVMVSKVVRRAGGSPGRLMDAESCAGTVESLQEWIDRN